MAPGDVWRHCRLGPPAEALLRQAIAKLGLSARAYTRVLKLAQTLADLGGATEMEPGDLSEAIQYRVLDRAPLPAATRV